MKTSQDPRHKKRIEDVKRLFEVSFSGSSPDAEIEAILPHLSTLDEAIQKAAPEWPVEKIAKIDLAILRLATYELAIIAKEPPKVIIDEAVEIAKEYGNENSAKFVNGVLGTFLKTL